MVIDSESRFRVSTLSAGVGTLLTLVHLLEKGANGPNRQFAARQDFALRFSEAAVHAPRNTPTFRELESAVQTGALRIQRTIPQQLSTQPSRT
jgi:hypothetical protein